MDEATRAIARVTLKDPGMLEALCSLRQTPVGMRGRVLTDSEGYAIWSTQ